jgi:tRNA threonylcarbamoyladenosine biosynthesis protein TsaE
MDMMQSIQVELPDLQTTRDHAAKLAAHVQVPQLIALSGTLGAGKTQWIRYFCESLGVPAEVITSPTYVLQHRYRGNDVEIYHFDFYRLDSEQQVWDLGFDELQESAVIILVEWAEKFPKTLPKDRLDLHLEVTSSGARLATLWPTGPKSERCM